MHRCLKCNYQLVFLEKRHKYKCAKCSSLFTEEEIKLEEFKKYNKEKREEEEVRIEEEGKEERKAERKRRLNERRLNGRKLKTDNPNYGKEYYQKNKERITKQLREYYIEHREEISKSRREKYSANKENETRKIRRNKNIETTRINGRIEYWKRKQKIMAESRFDEFLIKNPFDNPRKILPTFTLA
jgi:hypothetical protein